MSEASRSEHLPEDLLARLAEGEEDPAAHPHASACPECRAQLESYRRTGALLASYAPASRNLCPPRSALLDRGALRGAERSTLEAHLHVCPLCTEDLADLAALEAPPRVALAVRFARGLVELVENALGELLPQAEPALARGGATGQTVSVRRDLGAGVSLEVSLGPGRGGVDVLVRLEGATRFRAELARAGRLVEGRESREGRVAFDGVAPGAYELLVHRAAEPPVLVALGVEGS